MVDTGEYDCPMPETFGEKIRITLFLTWLFYLGFVSRVVFGPLMPEIQADAGFSNSDAGYLFFLLTIGYLIAPIFSGLISSKINHLGTLKLSAWLLGVALLPLVFVTSFWGMGLILMLIGFTGFLHLPSAIATITAEIQKSDWGKGLGLHQCAPPLAFVSAPLIAALFLNWWSWRQILLCWSLLALISALIYTVFGEGGEFPGRPISPANMKRVAGIPSFWILSLLLSMGMAGNAGLFAMLPLFFVSERGFDLATANTLLGCSQISGLFAVFLAGILADKVGQKKIMCFSLSGAALLTIGLAWLEGPLLIAALFLQPAVLTMFFPAAFGALARVAHPSMRSVTSAMGPPIAVLLGAGVIPAAIGLLADVSTFNMGIMAAGVWMMLGAPLVFLLRLADFDDASGC